MKRVSDACIKCVLLTAYGRLFVDGCSYHSESQHSEQRNLQQVEVLPPDAVFVVHPNRGPHPSQRDRQATRSTLVSSLGETIYACGTPLPEAVSTYSMNELNPGGSRSRRRHLAAGSESFFEALIRFLLELFGMGPNDSDEPSPPEPTMEPQPPPTSEPIQDVEIETYYHVIKSKKHPKKREVEKQHDKLEKAFEDTPFNFKLRKVEEYDEDAWYNYTGFNSAEELAMKTELRQGTAETLNVYVNKGNGQCGYTYLPEFYSDFPVWDGIVMNEGCILGDIGSALTHEVGHWLGLLHTVRVSIFSDDNSDIS